MPNMTNNRTLIKYKIFSPSDTAATDISEAIFKIIFTVCNSNQDKNIESWLNNNVFSLSDIAMKHKCYKVEYT